MRFTERKDFLYDTQLFGATDAATAMAIHDDYISRHAFSRPKPRVFEVDREPDNFDTLWHMPLDERTKVSRQFDITTLVEPSKPDYRLTRIGLVPQRRCRFWMSNLELQRVDWFPQRGDLIYWNGYRNMIIEVVFEPESFWHQTNIWLGLAVDTIIPADGDARPLVNLGQAAPREIAMTRPLPEV